MIATARANAHRHVELLLAGQPAAKRCGELDALVAGSEGENSAVADLRRRIVRTGVKELLGQVTQYRRLVALGVAEIDVTTLPPARRRALRWRRPFWGSWTRSITDGWAGRADGLRLWGRSRRRRARAGCGAREGCFFEVRERLKLKRVAGRWEGCSTFSSQFSFRSWPLSTARPVC
jgi:hypothetical protein